MKRLKIYPVLFFLLFLFPAFATEEKIEEKSIYKKDIFTIKSYKSLKEWQEKFPHQEQIEIVGKEFLHDKSQTGTFSIEIFLIDEKETTTGFLADPTKIKVLSLLPNTVFFNDIPYLHKLGEEDKKWKDAYFKKIDNKPNYFYALPLEKRLFSELKKIKFIFSPKNLPSNEISFFDKTLFREIIKKEIIQVNFLIQTLKELDQSFGSRAEKYLTIKGYKDDFKDLENNEELNRKLKEIRNYLNEEIGFRLLKIENEKNVIGPFLKDVDKYLISKKIGFKELKKGINEIDRILKDCFTIFKLAFVKTDISMKYSNLKKIFEEIDINKISTYSFLDQILKNNKEEMDPAFIKNYYSHLETSIPFFIYKKGGLFDEIKQHIQKNFSEVKIALISFVNYTNKNACEGCLANSFLIWADAPNILKKELGSDIPTTYISVFKEEDDNILLTGESTMGHKNKFFTPFKFLQPDQERSLVPNTIDIKNIQEIQILWRHLFASSLIKDKRWLPHIYKSKDVKGLMEPFLENILLKTDYNFYKNWEKKEFKEEVEKQLKEIVDFYPLSIKISKKRKERGTK